MDIIEFIVNAFGTYGYLIVFLAILIDSLPFGGTIVPEEFILAFAGVSAANDTSRVVSFAILAAVAMLIGQVLVYFIGRRYGEKALDKLNVSQKRRDQMEVFILKNKLWFNLVARFSSTLRSVIGLLSGLHRIDFRQFLAYELAVIVVKVPFFLGLGYFFGVGSEQLDSLVEQITVMTGVVIGFSLLISIGVTYYTDSKTR